MINRCSTSSLQKSTQNPYLEQWRSEPEILENSSAQDLYRRNDYQQFVGPQFRETIPMSIGTNIIGRNHNGLLDGMPILTRCSGTLWNIRIYTTTICWQKVILENHKLCSCQCAFSECFSQCKYWSQCHILLLSLGRVFLLSWMFHSEWKDRIEATFAIFRTYSNQLIQILVGIYWYMIIVLLHVLWLYMSSFPSVYLVTPLKFYHQQ